MKKILSFLLILSLLFAFAGCKNTAEETTLPETQPDTTPMDTTETAADVPMDDPLSMIPMSAVILPAVTEKTFSEDSTLLATYTYQNISMIFPDQEVADKVILDFLNRVDSFRSTADSIIASAKAAYTDSTEWSPYFCNVNYTPARIDQGVLSLFGYCSTFNRSAHSTTTFISANYDLVTGDVLTLASIMSPTATREDFCNLVLEELSGRTDLYDGYEQMVRDRFSVDETQDEGWTLYDSGLVFSFDPYEIAPYTSGVIQVTIPYEKLTGLLNDAYFPAEQDLTDGSIHCIPFEDADLSQFDTIAEVNLDRDGRKVLVYADRSVTHVRISAWNDLEQECSVFAAQHLSPGDAIVITENEADYPAVTIHYKSGDEFFTLHP